MIRVVNPGSDADFLPIRIRIRNTGPGSAWTQFKFLTKCVCEYIFFLLRFACQGLKKQPSDQTEKIFQLIKVINRKFLRSKVVPIAEETRKVIQEKIGSKDSGQDIFDTAQLEVEDRMTRTTYRNFLASEAYLNYVQMMQTGESMLTNKGWVRLFR
jgi:hypothetical protein